MTKTETTILRALAVASYQDDKPDKYTKTVLNNDYSHSAMALSYTTGTPFSTASRILRKLHAQGELTRKLIEPEMMGRSSYAYWFANGNAAPDLTCPLCLKTLAHSASKKVS